MRIVIVIAASLFVFVAACSGGNGANYDDSSVTPKPTLIIGGIPDQNVSALEEMFGGMAAYLAQELGIKVEYQPMTSYAALVTAFKDGDVQLAWFGGLTGVQARNMTPGAMAVLQRPSDAEFQSVFIVGTGVTADSLADLRGMSFTFGSESSTSGHLMPRWYLLQTGIDPEKDFRGAPSYSGSHDKTWLLVETGSFDAGVLNAAVWYRAVAGGQVDTTKVRILQDVGPYYDYHWLVNPLIDERYGTGMTDRMVAAIKGLSVDDPAQEKLLDLFSTDRFVDTRNENYSQIEETARALGLIE
ncbi:MAG: putative selenate ABC transporter substrate-binding protein [Chloroflexi bacterium]|nr:putative selenate ABC transporter substrate-binding protein [Chloroflexota bacterium]